MPRVRITAPSRLHFGLWSLGDGQRRQFGGVGAMIDRPQLHLTIESAAQFSARGPDADRVCLFSGRWSEFYSRPMPECRIQIHSAIPSHAGLGSGTQLALSIAAGLSAFYELPTQSPQELALSVGRGLRSAVGTYGFAYGGLIVEQGKLPDEPISPLDCRFDLPREWRFVLIRPKSLWGLAGDDEAAAFGSLPHMPQSVTDQLMALARDRLVPAAATANFPLFAETVYEYGRLSGECFAARQGGPFNGPLITSIIEQIRRLGHFGVGQSSWGPTVFVATPSAGSADSLLTVLRRQYDPSNFELLIASADNGGAQIEVAGLAELASHG